MALGGLGIAGLAIGSFAAGAVALGALAIGTMTIGRLVIRRLAVKDARFESLTVQNLTILDLSVCPMINEVSLCSLRTNSARLNAIAADSPRKSSEIREKLVLRLRGCHRVSRPADAVYDTDT